MSPTVSSLASISLTSPSLLTIAILDTSPLRLSIAFCDLYSWMKPKIVFRSTARRITPASITSPIANDAIAATIKRAIRMSANWDKNSTISGVGFFSTISFKPYSFCLFSTSLSVKPSFDVLYSDNMSLIKSP